MNNLTITIPDLPKFQARMRQAPDKVHREVNKTLLNIGIDMQRSAISEAPVYTGNLQSSIRLQRGDMTYRIIPTSKYAKYAHDGRRPGRMPPVRAVEGWARKHGMNPYLLARAIGRKGTKGKKFMDMAFNQSEPQASREIRQMVSRIINAI